MTSEPRRPWWTSSLTWGPHPYHQAVGPIKSRFCTQEGATNLTGRQKMLTMTQWGNKIRKVNSMENIEILKVFFTHHMSLIHWCDPRPVLLLRLLLHQCHPRSLSRNSVFQQWQCFTTCQNNEATSPTAVQQLTLVIQVAYPHRKNETQTDRHGWAHKVFFTDARAWRTSKKARKKAVVLSCLHTSAMSTDFEMFVHNFLFCTAMVEATWQTDPQGLII
jgi:hypothetical protein